MSKKIPISFNKQQLEDLKVLAGLYGISGIYGEIPQTIRISITFAKKYLEILAEIIPDLNSKELPFLFSTIKNIKKIQKTRDQQDKLDNLLD